jgi:hypothetical protein
MEATVTPRKANCTSLGFLSDSVVPQEYLSCASGAQVKFFRKKPRDLRGWTPKAYERNLQGLQGLTTSGILVQLPGQDGSQKKDFVRTDYNFFFSVLVLVFVFLFFSPTQQ